MNRREFLKRIAVSLSAYDVLWRTTRDFHKSVGNDPLAEVKASPAVVFRANGFEPDPAQLELLLCQDRNILVLWTRQFAGKSQTAATIALHYAMTNLGKRGRGSTTLVFSSALREAVELLRKVRHLRYGLVHQHVPTSGKSWRPRSILKDVKRWQEWGEAGGAANPGGEAKSQRSESILPPEINAVTDAQTTIELENGSRIISLPARSAAVVGYTVDLLILDEAKLIPDDLYKSVRPMLATTGGRMIALTTPLGQRGWFWEAWKQCEEALLRGEPEPYKRFRRTCWDCPRLDRKFVENERRLIGDFWFRQEYLVEFLSPAGAVFRTEDIDRALVSKEEPYHLPWEVT